MAQTELDILVKRYPESYQRIEAQRIISSAIRYRDTGAEPKFVLGNIVYAIFLLEARRRGISKRRPDDYATFRRQMLSALAIWVRGKDPIVDGIREVIEKTTGYRNAELNALLQSLLDAELSRTSGEQRRRASSPRHPKVIDNYIREALLNNPHLSLEDLWRRMNDDQPGPVVMDVTPDEVVIKSPRNGKLREAADEDRDYETLVYSRGSILNRYYRIRRSITESQ